MLEELEELNTKSTMQVISTFKKGKKRYCTVVCPDCNKQLEVRFDAIKIGGYKEQKVCRKCSYIVRDGKDSQGYTSKYKYLYWVYNGMISRCYNPCLESYKNYGAKGVTVCDEWKDSFVSFVDWALDQGFTYDELKELEIDKDYLSEKLGVTPSMYSPKTCRFISRHLNNIIKPKQDNTTSQYIGVNWNKTLKRWEWGLRLKDGTRKRGYGTTELEAAEKRESFIISNNLSHRRNNV